MSALGQSAAALAPVLGLAMLGALQARNAAALLALQAITVAVAAAAWRQPVPAGLALAANAVTVTWVLRILRRTDAASLTPMSRSARTAGLLAGLVLAALSQAQGALAQPLATLLLALLSVALTHDAPRRLLALAALMNGSILVAVVAQVPPLAALPCLLVPLPFALAGTLHFTPVARSAAAPLPRRHRAAQRQRVPLTVHTLSLIHI